MGRKKEAEEAYEEDDEEENEDGTLIKSEVPAGFNGKPNVIAVPNVLPDLTRMQRRTYRHVERKCSCIEIAFVRAFLVYLILCFGSVVLFFLCRKRFDLEHWPRNFVNLILSPGSDKKDWIGGQQRHQAERVDSTFPLIRIWTNLLSYSRRFSRLLSCVDPKLR